MFRKFSLLPSSGEVYFRRTTVLILIIFAVNGFEPLNFFCFCLGYGLGCYSGTQTTRPSIPNQSQDTKLVGSNHGYIRMDLREIGIITRNWVNLAQDRDYWNALVNVALNPRVP